MKSTVTALAILQMTCIASFLTGCSEWSSEPMRLKQDYGNSVRQMSGAQVYDQAKLAHPNPEPLKTYDANKGDRVLEKTYRNDIGDPERVKAPLILRTGSTTGAGR